MRYSAMLVLLPLLLLAAVSVTAVDGVTLGPRYVVGDILGNLTHPDDGFVVANVTTPDDGTDALYRVYAVQKNGGRWEIPLYYNHADEFTETSITAAGLRRIDHADPIVVIITDPTITGGDMKYTGLSLSEALAGVIYPVEPAPGEPASISPLYVVGDVLGDTSAPASGHVVASVFTSDGTLFYRTYDVVKNGNRWEIPRYVGDAFSFPEDVLISQGLRRIAHADPHTVVVTDTTTSGGDVRWTLLDLSEIAARAGDGYPLELRDVPPSAGDLPRYLVGDILGTDASSTTGWVISQVQTSTDNYTVYHFYDVVKNGARWEIPDYVVSDIDELAIFNLGRHRIDHVDPHFVIVTDRHADTTETYHYGLSLGEILEGTRGYPFEGILPTPFKQLTIPGRIEAEDYDLGGEGVAYHDTTPGNLGGVYRHDDVDIENTAGESTPNVGWIRSGEFLSYTANVTREGTYTVTARVASPNAGRRMSLSVIGGDTATITVPNTGSFATFRTVTVPINLTAGMQTLVLSFSGDGMNVNWLDFAQGGPTPFKDLAIPGTIQAEDYDLGGEGVAYHDTTPGNEGGAYRHDDVDIENTAGESTPNVGWIRSGEYLTYTATVRTAGAYTMTARVASPNSGRTAALSVDGAAAATIAVPNTGSFATFRTVSTPVTLAAGTHVLKLTFSGDGQNLDWIAFASGAVTTTPTTPAPSGASFVAVPTTAPYGSAVKFTVTPANGKSISAALWSFDVPAHLNTWNSRDVNPTFFYPVRGTFSPQVKLTYTDASTETVERANYITAT